ncbi:MAG: peptidoglycan DD-metalloendopeptidase family protein, partial [candidate division Zixibacteria bacterium]|nr:peptidoglycan DD-metalloendopeptidase family protein [candidate division Zixibacteria bacterium]
MKLSITCILILIILAPAAILADDWRAPVDGTIQSSSLFGDYRPGHFHAGIDIRTGGATGIKLYACSDGYIERVKTSFDGYGRAVYLRSNSGFVFVYAHLSRLFPDLQQAVYQQQINNENYKQDIYFTPAEFRLMKGDIIGYSGQAGPGGPHLHFEIRTPDNIPTNPLLYNNIRLRDNVAPLLSSIAIAEFKEQFHPGDIVSKTTYDCEKIKRGTHYLVREKVYTSGRFGIELNAYDQIDGYYGKFGVYDLKLFFDNSLIYHYRADSLDFASFTQSDYVRDYQLWFQGVRQHNNPKRVDKDRHNFYRLFRVIGDAQPTIKSGLFNGLFSIYPDDSLYANMVSTGEHEIRIEARDIYDNHSVLNLTLNIGEIDSAEVKQPSADNGEEQEPSFDGIVFLYGSIHVDITPEKLYYPEEFSASVLNQSRMQNDFYVLREFEIFPRFTFFRDKCTLSTKIGDSLYSPEKYCIGWQNIDGEFVFAGNELSDDSLTVSCKIKSTGRFALVADYDPPELTLMEPRNGTHLRASSEFAIRYRLTDNFAGLGNEEDLDLYLDGNWVPAEYDPDRDLVEFIPYRKLNKGKHTLLIQVRDMCNNQTNLE